jgi:hypothetical protein
MVINYTGFTPNLRKHQDWLSFAIVAFIATFITHPGSPISFTAGVSTFEGPESFMARAALVCTS